MCAVANDRKAIPKVFIAGCIVVWVILGVLLVVIPKGELHLILCDHHTEVLDWVIPAYSNIVNWLPYVLIVALLFYKAGWSCLLAADIILTTAIVQPVKHLVCAPRPITWFAIHVPDVMLPTTPGVTMHEWCSFPSGHTTNFFVVACVMALLVKDYWCQRADKGECMSHQAEGAIEVVLVLFASVGAYTRLYMSQHFALDVFAGMAIGMGCTMALWLMAQKWVIDRRFWDWRVRFTKK